MARGREAAAKRTGAAQANGGGEPLVVYFDDIRLVRDLLGDYDANLAVLEDRLGVEAVVNGNAVALRGPDEACAAAKSVLEQLYGRLAQGEMIGVGEVVGAIRHARGASRRDGGTRRWRADSAADPHPQAPDHGAHAGAKRLPRPRYSATISCLPPGRPARERPILPWRSRPLASKPDAATG
ncbi:MAG: hypothetical protein R3D01_08620 [Hyphomicrobiales bacterium]